MHNYLTASSNFKKAWQVQHVTCLRLLQNMSFEDINFLIGPFGIHHQFSRNSTQEDSMFVLYLYL